MPEPSVETAASSSGSTSSPAEPGAGGAQQQPRLGAGGEAGGEQVLALGHEQALALAVLALPQLADQFQLLVVGAGDHLVSLLFWCFFSWKQKEAGLAKVRSPPGKVE